MTNGQEKSDLFIVAMKLANKPGRPGAESVEPRKRTEGNTGEQHTCRTQSRESVSQEARLGTRGCSWGFVVNSPEVGARCVNYARRDLCGGCPVMGIPTAIAYL
jgi:hypothetical protein